MHAIVDNGLAQISALAALLQLKTADVSLNALSLVALASSTSPQTRTALTGTSALTDVLVLCPGIHLQKSAASLSGGEYPACAALTTGYVFRVENPATVYYLQRVGRPGHLTTLSVSGIGDRASDGTNFGVPRLAYSAAVFATLVVSALLFSLGDWWALTFVSMLVTSRLCHTLIIRRRSTYTWSGASEPGQQGDLLILLSQDRWVRMQGAVDDLKRVTSGQWLRDETFLENSISAFATVLVYLAVALAFNATSGGQILLFLLLISSSALLGLANATTKELQMHGNTLRVVGEPKKYRRRLDLARELIKETGRDDWAIRMAMIDKSDGGKAVM
ncbi:hypothetical protein jhhlp_006673 [Lomentospora prolificans]|uniref:Uncharacterized protein n=1 Tax=Lomentospora prolificans TaxID=41688 RepID=A0A2N3N6K3_9PEZI|nr:hypothetical protein jhhlp_006673 [Lomentospora prolificans]